MEKLGFPALVFVLRARPVNHLSHMAFGPSGFIVVGCLTPYDVMCMLPNTFVHEVVQLRRN